MEIRKYILMVILPFVFITAVNAYTTKIYAPAVLPNQQKGTLTLIQLNLTPGNGTVSVDGPAIVGISTVDSAKTAASYAASFVGVNKDSYNFNYTIKDQAANVSGPSAGLAFTLLAVAALENKQLYTNFTVTGTINQNGSVGDIGGVYDKMGAAKAGHMQYMLLPKTSDNTELMLYYIARQTYNLPVLEVANVSQALHYVFSNSTAEIMPFAYNVSQKYRLSGLEDASLKCNSCNTSYFNSLSAFTLNFTKSEISSISSNFSEVKNQLLSQLTVANSVIGKGYLYTGADIAFISYVNAFTFANSNNYNIDNARQIIDNVSFYCSAITPPQMTSTNYEYVVGGELRQAWAKTYIQQADTLLNVSESTDEVIQSLSIIAQSSGWCNAASQMYGIASGMGGTPVATSQAIKQLALNEINRASSYGPSLYLTGALQDYNNSNYAAALYGAEYAAVFDNPSTLTTYTKVQLVRMTKQNAANATYGVWPSQFANEALFYIQQSPAKSTAADTNITSAYITSELALGLSNINSKISSTFVPINTTQLQLYSILDNQSKEITTLTKRVDTFEEYFFVIMALQVILIIVAIALIAVTLRKKPAKRINRRT